MSNQIWRATWWEDGRSKQFVFSSVDNLMIARIDFRLKFPYAFKDSRPPEKYTLEEHGGTYKQTYSTPLAL